MTEKTEQTLAVLDSASSVAALLSPLRRDILSQLHEQEDSASGLARKIGLPRQKVNYHVRMLEKEGFLELAGEEKKRGCTERRFRPTARAYLIQPDMLGGLGGDPTEIRDRFSSAYLIALAAQTLRDVARLRSGADQAGKRLPTFALELDLNFKTPDQRTQFAEELTDAVARLAARYQDDGPNSRAYRFVISGHPAVNSDAIKGEDRNVDQHD